MAAPHTNQGTPVRRGGLIVPVPEAEDILQTWRARLGPTIEASVPAHVTILFPFLTLAELDADGLADLHAHFLRTPSVEVMFSTAALFPDVVYLAPEPRDWFIGCTQALSARFGLLPYGGLHSEVVPHLTVARHPDPAVLADIAQQLTTALPLVTQVREVWLMEELAAGGWSHTATFPLGR
jgi:2'-5' RNA ligase